ncbi:DNA cytosine methyltransferase [Aliivibrio logei]|uniref:DNA (cytosine-5-)-methyltransferase n=1 Tax=Aliivibrio logei 5S-186 TaxID=626086 RepID=A0ABX3AX44_ALILO|nr:DNA cytosine methyltransferase [Aliivibrio logei]OEF18992.1 restriction endonuclease [Aliivibrio logei 5S-186]
MLNYVSLFSSAGVGCFGLKLEGFTCIATAELIQRRIDIQKENNKCKYSTGYICGDLTTPEVHEQLFSEITTFKKKEKVKQIDLIVATPPCQGMSVANHKKKEELGRNSLVVESIKIVKDALPKYFVFENVSAFLKSICTDVDGEDKSIKDAIIYHLSSHYSIEFKIINLKNYGSNSSRTRTLVVGVNKDLKEITPLDIFPDYVEEQTLFDVIGHMPALNEMGEFDVKDIYHSFRPYKEHMLPWIQATPYGKSAFDNADDKLKPHQVIDGEIIVNKSKNGDKYQRQLWEKVAPCIHTRNDCLPSQNTVHPVDDRVFSIRELMLIMTIPEEFKWVSDSELPTNDDSFELKAKFRKKTEFNIRQCIGEAVPTEIFRVIGSKIKVIEESKKKDAKYLTKLIEDNNLSDFDELMLFLKQASSEYSKYELFRICELANAQRLHTAAFYTRQNICYSVVESLPDFSKKEIRILEPSVGVGNFLYLIAKKYQDKKVIIDCVDINKESLIICEFLARKYLPKNVTINYINDDFLLCDKVSKIKYDIVIGNPPYMKLKGEPKLLKQYQANVLNNKTNNLFAFFIERAIKLADYVALIVPKALLNAPEYSVTRDILSKLKLVKLIDYNEKAFDVKIETISFVAKTSLAPTNHQVVVESYLRKETFKQELHYITTGLFDSWFLYRNEEFDAVCEILHFGKFKVFRDRQITKSNSYEEGSIRVIKSRNIGNNEILNIEGYDRYVNNLNGYAVAKYMNSSSILVPNLTYNPRAARLPSNCIADGSAAILISEDDVSDEQIQYFSSSEFNLFYRIARNYGTRSMNIDSVSVNYFGVKKL